MTLRVMSKRGSAAVGSSPVVDETEVAGGQLRLTKEEEQYVVWFETRKNTEGCQADEMALREIGLNDQEVAYLAAVVEAVGRYGTPASCGLSDGLRYLLWELSCLPRTDKIAGRVTRQSFIDSVSCSSAGYHKDGHVPEKDFCIALKYRLGDASDALKKTPLFWVLEKVFRWCKVFASIHHIEENKSEEVVLGVDDGILAEELQRRVCLEGTEAQPDFLANEQGPNKHRGFPREKQAELFGINGAGGEGVRGLTEESKAEGEFAADKRPATEKQKKYLSKLMGEEGENCANIDIGALRLKQASQMIDEIVSGRRSGRGQWVERQ